MTDLREPQRRQEVGGVTLTARQRDVLRMIAAGKTNAQIADELGVSLEGAKWHVGELLTKLSVDSREEAAEWWRAQNGIGARVRRLGFALALPGLKWVGAGVGATALAGGAVLVVLSTLGGGEAGDPLDPAETATTAPATATPTTAPTATPTLTPIPEHIARDAASMAAILNAHIAEDRALPRFEGILGPFFVTPDDSVFTVEHNYPCTQISGFELHATATPEWVDSELNFEFTPVGERWQSVCEGGVVRYVYANLIARYYYAEGPPDIFIDAPVTRLELIDVDGYPAVVEIPATADFERYGLGGHWQIWVVQRTPAGNTPGIVIHTRDAGSRAEAIATARAILAQQ